MRPAQIRKIIRLLEEAGFIAIRLRDRLWLVLLPIQATTLTVIAEHSFNPHERREEIRAARPLLIGFGWHPPVPEPWMLMGAVPVEVKEIEDLEFALAAQGFDHALALGET